MTGSVKQHMYLQCSFCGYLNEYSTTSLTSQCTLCAEPLFSENIVSFSHMLRQQDDSATCTRCMRDLLMNGACTYCAALYAEAPNILLAPLAMFSGVLRTLHMQPPGLAERHQRARSSASMASRPIGPSARDASPPSNQAAAHGGLGTFPLWSASLSPPPGLQHSYQAASVSLVDFGALDLSFLLGVDNNAADAEMEQAEEYTIPIQHDRMPLSLESRALLRTPTSVPSEFVCSVCLNGADTAADLTRLPCEHIFHNTCVNQWFMSRSTCPMCRDSLHRRSFPEHPSHPSHQPPPTEQLHVQTFSHAST